MTVTEIEWLFPDGDGGAPHENGVVRLPGTIPGDVVSWHMTKSQGRTVTGAVDAVERPSPHRVPAVCAWDATCGGCDLSMFAADPRRVALANIAQRAFSLPTPPPLVASPDGGQRARISLSLAGGQVGYRGNRSHDLVTPETCRIARPEVDAALGVLREWLAVHPSEGLSRVELRSDGERVAYAFNSEGSVPRAVRDELVSLGDVALDGRTLHGDAIRWLTVAGLRLRASPKSFYQVNLAINELLVAHVVSLVKGFRAERVLDLYSGIGNLSVPIAAQKVPVIAVEREGQATADLRVNMGKFPVKVFEHDVEKFDTSRDAFDVAVLDPPRAGAPGVLPKVLQSRPRALIYVACDVVNAARDLKVAQAAGFRITDVRCFEMFPETRHFETVIALAR